MNVKLNDRYKTSSFRITNTEKIRVFIGAHASTDRLYNNKQLYILLTFTETVYFSYHFGRCGGIFNRFLLIYILSRAGVVQTKTRRLSV